MRKIQAALCGALLVLATGSGCPSPMRYDASKFDQQCPAWQEQRRRHDKAAQFAAEENGMQAYYEYYMCLNMMYIDDIGMNKVQYFFDNVNEFIAIVPDKLNGNRNLKELYVLSRLLLILHKNKYYNVSADNSVMSAWRAAIEQRANLKNSSFNDIYSKVVQSQF